MKQRFVIALLFLVVIAPTIKGEKPTFGYSVGADLVSAYLWRGESWGGISFQPTVEVNYGDVALGVWGSIGPSDWRFDDKTFFSPEIDLYLTYTIGRLTATVIHIHYFDGPRYLDFSNNRGNHNETEARLFYIISEQFPMTIHWATQIAGGDNLYKHNPSKGSKRAFSSYMEFRYDFQLPYEVLVRSTVGFSPFKSRSSNYTTGFVVNNLSLRAKRAFQLHKSLSFSTFAQPMFNPYTAKFLWAVGVEVWL